VPLPPHTPGTSESVCLGLILWPVALPPFLCTLCAFILGEVAAGCSHCHMCLAAQDVLGLSVDFLSYGRHFCCVQELASCAQVHQFVFPPSLVGVKLRREHGSHSFVSTFVKQLT
jgi:hypothetical protein